MLNPINSKAATVETAAGAVLILQPSMLLVAMLPMIVGFTLSSIVTLKAGVVTEHCPPPRLSVTLTVPGVVFPQSTVIECVPWPPVIVPPINPPTPPVLLSPPNHDDMAENDQAPAQPAAISGDSSLLPSPFEGKLGDDGDAWLKYFNEFCVYKGVNGKPQQRQLFKLLMRSQAADWFNSLADAEIDTFPHIQEAFRKRYAQSELLKYKTAKDIFTRKQAINESVDDYIAAMQKMARRVSETPNEEMTRFAILAGLHPRIANGVIAKQPKTIPELLDAARIAELTAPPAVDDSIVHLQMAMLEAEIKRLEKKIERGTTAAISTGQRSPTPERRHVSFDEQSQSPAARAPFTPFRRPIPARDQRYQSSPRNQWHGRSATSQSFARSFHPKTSTPGPEQSKCFRCGYRVHDDDRKCPALAPNRPCARCRRPGYFEPVCHSAPRGQSQRQ